MTWEAFGEMLEQFGIALDKTKINSLMEHEAIKSRGGNKIAIDNWTDLAQAIGIDTNNPGYISAFSSYNDAMIEMNRETENHIVDEVGKLKDAKGGDWLNLTYFSDLLNSIDEYDYNGGLHSYTVLSTLNSKLKK